mgnify:CR=1 FL=1
MVKGKVNPTVKGEVKGKVKGGVGKGLSLFAFAFPYAYNISKNTNVFFTPRCYQIFQERKKQKKPETTKKPKSRKVQLVVPQKLWKVKYMRDLAYYDGIKESDHVVLRLACKMFRNVAEIYPDHLTLKNMTVKSFIEPVYEMVNIDKRLPKEIYYVHNWAIQDDFHGLNSRHTTYIRKHYEKLRAEMQKNSQVSAEEKKRNKETDEEILNTKTPW